MNKVLIIGGGFAGLSAAVHLSSHGYSVKVFESSPKLGGRAYSFRDTVTGDIIDNGQHIMMGCYTETLAFLKTIDSIQNISIQKKLKVIFTDKHKGNLSLAAIKTVYPLDLLLGILNYRALSLRERIGVLKLYTRLIFTSGKKLNSLSVKEWLINEGQSINSIKSFWEIIAVGALNCSTQKASAFLFAHILKEMFLKGSKAASIIIPGTGLTEMYCNAASDYIRSNGGDICLSSPVTKIKLKDNKVSGVVVNNSEYQDFDWLISAVPFFAVNKFLPESIVDVSHLKPSAILSVHLWIKNNPFTEKFYGLINSEIHWIFNHTNYITIVISDADRYMQMSREDIFRIVVNEINSFFSYFDEAQITNYKIIKEKRATFIPDKEIINKRPDPKTRLSNLFLAGDYTNTGLPATIEGAVKSGRLAAEFIIKNRP